MNDSGNSFSFGFLKDTVNDLYTKGYNVKDIMDYIYDTFGIQVIEEDIVILLESEQDISPEELARQTIMENSAKTLSNDLDKIDTMISEFWTTFNSTESKFSDKRDSARMLLSLWELKFKHLGIGKQPDKDFKLKNRDKLIENLKKAGIKLDTIDKVDE